MKSDQDSADLVGDRIKEVRGRGCADFSREHGS